LGFEVCPKNKAVCERRLQIPMRTNLAEGVLNNRSAQETLLMIDVDNFDVSHPALRVRPEAPEMHREDVKRSAADLYWLAFLLTGRRDISIDIAADGAVAMANENLFFAGWMRAWSRRIVIAKALAASRDDLAKSARQTKLAGEPFFARSAGRPLSPQTSKADIEEALLAIGTFPRAAVILLVLEGVPIADAATLLDADVSLVKKAQAIGLRELTAKLGQKSGNLWLDKAAD
jgi:DNA-directed RNA polymerase specialized sigma24 family protein